MTKSESNHPSRRRFLGKAAYVAPLILTLQASPAYAARGSGGDQDCRRRRRRSCQRDRNDCDNSNQGNSGGSSWFGRLVVFLSG